MALSGGCLILTSLASLYLSLVSVPVSVPPHVFILVVTMLCSMYTLVECVLLLQTCQGPSLEPSPVSANGST